MSATTEKPTYSCTCGRTFANEQILKYHQRVTKHGEQEGEAAESAAPAVAVAVASPAAPMPAVVAVAPEAAAAEEPVALGDAPAPVDFGQLAYLRALEVLEAKRAQQEAFERREVTRRAVTEIFGMASEGARATGRALAEGAAVGTDYARRALVVFLFLLATASIVTAGLGLGRAVATVSGMGIAQALESNGTIVRT